MSRIIESYNCNVCGSGDLQIVFDAPAMPLTGIYLKNDALEALPVFDQDFLFCDDCGHGQLRNVIAPSILYDATYTHRTTSSPIATKGNDFFFDQLLKITNGRSFNTLLEVGCNDLYLLNRTQGLAKNVIGVDPIWIDRDHDLNSKTRVLGRFIEDIDINRDIGSKPDLIISAHTFEHIQDFYGQLATLVEFADDECLFVIEMPSLESLLDQYRFDQVFHQHIQYVSLSSMRRLVLRLGCRFLGHTFNYDYWGGTLLFWFEKVGNNIDNDFQQFEALDVWSLRRKFADFKLSLQVTLDQVSSLKEDCFGFGGAQMLPILAYHMGSDLDFMNAILDDNVDRSGTRLPGVSPEIRTPLVGEISDATIMITALDSARPILRRLIDVNPRRIIHPLHCF